jgi:sucrose-6-phosphate hydrolase SacC (GH32 family)
MTAERPRLHFTPPQNFMNDPNGLVFCDGEYHLFYQHNPHATVWGHMSWGHAVSRDLITWEHLPVALPEHDGLMMFSGSAVIDHDDTSGGTAGQPPMVLIYTAHDAAARRQTQALAYSTDRGRTFTRHAGNPVIDEDREHFRDPKVLWYEPEGCWLMVVSLGADRCVRFYRSADLKAWEVTGEFGPAGATDVPDWECPDLFPLPVEGTGEERWVLKVDVGDGSPAGGSGSQYFVGRFDGRSFLCDDAPDRTRWTDWGADFYAAQSWSNLPPGAAGGPARCIWVAWMSNWRYALATPTEPWRGMMTVPREVSLRRVGGDIVLVQRPIAQLLCAATPAEIVSYATRAPHLLRVVLARSSDHVGLVIGRPGDQCICGADFARGELFIDRRGLRAADFHADFPARHTAPIPAGVETLALEIVLDQNSVECFAADGEVVLSDLVFFDDAPGIQTLGGAEVLSWMGRYLDRTA